MTILDKEYPDKCAGCFAMRCQKCVIMDSKSVFEYLTKESEKKKPDWCPCHEFMVGVDVNRKGELEDDGK